MIHQCTILNSDTQEQQPHRRPAGRGPPGGMVRTSHSTWNCDDASGPDEGEQKHILERTGTNVSGVSWNAEPKAVVDQKGQHGDGSLQGLKTLVADVSRKGSCT